jgi:hypothetical protein
MTHLQYSDVDLCDQIETVNPFAPSFSGAGTALLTPDSDQASIEAENAPWSDYLTAETLSSPMCASGDDLDDDEAYFLEDDDDEDDDIEEDYDDDDDDDDEPGEDSSEEDDDEEL